MKPTLQQQQELRQQQRLTPMQVQFVRMLEMTGPELESEVDRALDEMPALEIAESPATQTDDTFKKPPNRCSSPTTATTTRYRHTCSRPATTVSTTPTTPP